MARVRIEKTTPFVFDADSLRPFSELLLAPEDVVRTVPSSNDRVRYTLGETRLTLFAPVEDGAAGLTSKMRWFDAGVRQGVVTGLEMDLIGTLDAALTPGATEAEIFEIVGLFQSLDLVVRTGSEGGAAITFDGDDRVILGDGLDWVFGSGGNDHIQGTADQDGPGDRLSYFGWPIARVGWPLMEAAGFGPDVGLDDPGVTLRDGLVEKPGGGVDRIEGIARVDGTLGRDQFFPGPGVTRIEGLAGDDLFDGRAQGAPEAWFDGGSGDDTAFGGRGRDGLGGDQGDDLLRGGSGKDTLRGGLGDDRIYGGPGDDYITSGHGVDTIHGGRGDDLIWVQSGPKFEDDTSGFARVRPGLGLDAVSFQPVILGTGREYARQPTKVIFRPEDLDDIGDSVFGFVPGYDQIVLRMGDDAVDVTLAPQVVWPVAPSDPTAQLLSVDGVPVARIIPFVGADQTLSLDDILIL